MPFRYSAGLARGLSLAAALFVAACAQPYDPPQVFDEQFAAGSTTELPARGFGGLDDIVQNDPRVVTTGETVRVLWTHGMCTPAKPGPHGAWWQVRVGDLMAAYPGATADESAATTQTLPGGAKLIKVGVHAPGGRAIELWFFDWTPITEPHKLVGDNDPESPKGNPYRYSRATVNESLKQGLMKNCLPEVVVYLGSNGDAIRSDTQIALCEFFGGAFDASTGCVGASDAHPTMMIAESIGSSILFDAFRTLRSDIAQERYGEAQKLAAASKGSLSKSEKAAMEAAMSASARANANGSGMGKAMGSLTTFFMLANQIPLINLANRTDAGGQERFDEFVSNAAELRPTGTKPLTVVAFVDPNDLLSFRLVPRSDRARVINFVVSNATTYAGYFERPDVAHCNYVRNGYVMHAIVYGYAGGEPQSGDVNDPDPCL